MPIAYLPTSTVPDTAEQLALWLAQWHGDTDSHDEIRPGPYRSIASGIIEYLGLPPVRELRSCEELAELPVGTAVRDSSGIVGEVDVRGTEKVVKFANGHIQPVRWMFAPGSFPITVLDIPSGDPRG